MTEYPYGLTEDEYKASVEVELDGLERRNAALKALHARDLEMMKADILSHKWLEEQNEKMKVVLDLIASEGCNMESAYMDMGSYKLRPCSASNPGHPDMWCYPCMAKKALED